MEKLNKAIYKNFFAENTGFFEYYDFILALKPGDNLKWYGTLCILNILYYLGAARQQNAA